MCSVTRCSVKSSSRTSYAAEAEAAALNTRPIMSSALRLSRAIFSNEPSRSFNQTASSGVPREALMGTRPSSGLAGKNSVPENTRSYNPPQTQVASRIGLHTTSGAVSGFAENRRRARCSRRTARWCDSRPAHPKSFHQEIVNRAFTARHGDCEVKAGLAPDGWSNERESASVEEEGNILVSGGDATYWSPFELCELRAAGVTVTV
ncbi:hypothetical protein Q1695_002794 [Nippostrongylus brasiliensis]|nr:hypothetical protein Q1695_002794 [Nippostrongylus brasiliensis]